MHTIKFEEIILFTLDKIYEFEICLIWENFCSIGYHKFQDQVATVQIICYYRNTVQEILGSLSLIYWQQKIWMIQKPAGQWWTFSLSTWFNKYRNYRKALRVYSYLSEFSLIRISTPYRSKFQLVRIDKKQYVRNKDNNYIDVCLTYL